MKINPSLLAGPLSVFCLVLMATSMEGAQADSRKPAAKATPIVAPGQQSQIPQSVFIIPPSPKEGRNPFFPESTTPLPTPRPITNDASGIVLNGITSPPKPTAMINGRTFEIGEPGEIRLPSGAKILIKCVEIKADSAIIVIDGQRRELRLRFGL